MAYAFESGSLSAAADCLDRAETTLCQAQSTSVPGQRYVLAHTAALRVAAAVLAVRARPRRTRGLCNAWTLLATVAPELSEWGEFFAAAALKRAAAASGAPRVVTSREADDLVRAVEQFLTVAERALRLSHEHSVGPAR